MAEVRIVVAAVLAAAADAVLVAHHLPKLGAHLVTALANLHVRNLARGKSLKAGSTRGWRRCRSRKKIIRQQCSRKDEVYGVMCAAAS